MFLILAISLLLFSVSGVLLGVFGDFGEGVRVGGVLKVVSSLTFA